MSRKSLTEATILIIDDQAFIRATTRQVLVMIGVRRENIHEAGSADSGMKETARNRPDIILCDIHMPGDDGLVYLDRLRNSEIAEITSTPVIMLTSDTTENTVLAARELRVSGYLLKPVSASSVQRALEAVFK